MRITLASRPSSSGKRRRGAQINVRRADDDRIGSKAHLCAPAATVGIVAVDVIVIA